MPNKNDEETVIGGALWRWLDRWLLHLEQICPKGQIV